MSNQPKQAAPAQASQNKTGNRMLRNLVVMLCVLAGIGVLTGGTLLLSHYLQREKPAEELYLLNRPEDGLYNVTLQLADGETVEIYSQDQGQTFALKGHESNNVSASKLLDLTSRMSSLTAVEVLEEQPTDDQLAEYGLLPAQATLTAKYQKNGDAILYLGNTTADQTTCYAQLDGQDTVYLIDQSDAYYLQRRNIGFYTVPVLDSVDTYNMELFRLDYRNQPTMEIVRDPAQTSASGLDTWKLVKPFEHAINMESFVRYLSTCSLFGLFEAVDANPTDLSVYGLDNPLFTVTLLDVSGNGYTLTVSDKGPVDSYAYCRVDDDPTVYTMSRFGLDQIKVSPTELAEAFVALIGLQYVDELHIEGRGEDLVFKHVQQESVDVNDQPITVSTYYLDGVEMQSSASITFYQSVVGMMASGVVDAHLDIQNWECKLTYVRESAGMSDLELYFIPYETDKYAVVNAAGYALNYVRVEDLDNMFNTLEEYRRGRLNKD